MHSLRLHWIVNFAKKVGLKNFFFKKEGRKPKLTQAEKTYLKKEYESDIKYVYNKYGEIF
jgi:hypothetical protein